MGVLLAECSLVLKDCSREGRKYRREDWRDVSLELVADFSLTLPFSYWRGGDPTAVCCVGEVLGLIGSPNDRRLVVVELDNRLNQFGLSGSLMLPTSNQLNKIQEKRYNDEHYREQGAVSVRVQGWCTPTR